MNPYRAMISGLFMLVLAAPATAQQALGTGFTYQGQIKWDGQPFTDMADFELTLWDDAGSGDPPTGGNQIGPLNSVDDVSVVDGLFTVEVDFGDSAFNGQQRWLQIAVRSPAGSGAYATLSPRQPLTAAPYARFSAAPWEKTGNDLFYNGGQVGIGTPSPGSTLDVRGGMHSQYVSGNNDNLTLRKSGDLGPANARFVFSHRSNGTELWLYGNDSVSGFRNLQGWDYANNRVRFPANGSNLVVDGSSGNVGVGTTTPDAKFDVLQSAATGSAAAITLSNPASTANALEVNNDGSGAGISVFKSTGGAGVLVFTPDPFGQALTGVGGLNGVNGTATGTGQTWGGYFQNSSSGGAGVFGSAGSPTGIVHGVHGVTYSPNGQGVYGFNNATVGTVIGVKGESAVFGVSGEGGLIGLHGIGIGTNGSFGVFGQSNAGSNGAGVVGQTDGTSGRAVWGNALGSAFSSGYAGYFEGRGHFSEHVGIGIAPPSSRLDVRDASGTSVVMNLQRTTAAAAQNDILQIIMPAGSSDNAQFIECERGTDIKFRVWGDGDVTADGTYSSPADFAEMILVTSGVDSVEAGDVMVIDVDNPRAVLKSTTPRSTLVAGVYSTKPGILGSEHDWDDVARELQIDPTSDEQYQSLKPIELGKRIGEIPMALVGIVPCKVSAENGPIKPGDLLVTAGLAGHAMRDANPRAGTIVGKALGNLDDGTGVIRVLVTLQ